MKTITCISKHPILCGHIDAGFVPATLVKHPDEGFVAVRLADGKFRYVDANGNCIDARDRAGLEEQFIEGVGGTVIAIRQGKPYVFAVA